MIIISTGSFDEVGMGWFTYYLAKMGGFNYLSKELEVDIDELDSFYNLYLENTRGRNCFEEIIDKVNGLIDEYI